MKLLTTTLISTLFFVSTAQASEPVKAAQINTADLQVAAQSYLAQNLPLMAVNTTSVDKHALLAKVSKQSTSEKLVESNRLVAE